MSADIGGAAYYDRQGRPISRDDFALLLFDEDAKRVALDTVDGYTVSTVWLGINHAFGGGPPLIFETMVFGSGNIFPWATADGPWSDYQDRYRTEADAVAGHARVVAAIQAGETP